MGLLDFIERKIIELLSPLLGPLRPLFTLFIRFRDNTIGILGAAQTLVSDVKTEYDQIKNFELRPAWKNRIISVPVAIQNIKDLAQVPSICADAFRDLVNQLRTKLQPASFELDDLEGIEDLRGILGKLGGRLAAGFEKLLGAVALIIDALVTIRATITDLQTIVDQIRTVREDLENLDGVFLQQKNPRRIEHLSDGGSIKIRVGNLHS